MQTQKGFTLIELLVVIAIIGILAGMVVVNMSSAPTAAKNAKIQSYFDQLRTTATVWFTNQNTYFGFDAAGSGDGATLKTKIGEVSNTYYSSSTASAFCARAQYVGTTTLWCVDSTNGFSGATSSASACSSTANTITCN